MNVEADIEKPRRGSRLAAGRRRIPVGAGGLALAFALAAPSVAELPQLHQTCASRAADPDARIAACETLIRTGHDSAHDLAVSHFNRGQALARKREFEAAISDYTRALDLFPMLVDAIEARGVAYGEAGMTDLAIADFDRFIAIHPQSAEAHANRGNGYLRKGELDRAAAEAATAIRIDPGFARGYLLRAIVAVRRRDDARAMTDVEQAIALDPGLAPAYERRGMIYSRQGRAERALADLDHAIRLDPSRPSAYASRAIVRHGHHELDAALADCEHAIALDPNHGPAYNTRGLVRRDQGLVDEAISDFDTAIRLDPRHVSALVNRAGTLERKGSFAAALADLDRALAMEPGNAEALGARHRVKLLLQTSASSDRPAVPPHAAKPAAVPDRGGAKQERAPADRAKPAAPTAPAVQAPEAPTPKAESSRKTAVLAALGTSTAQAPAPSPEPPPKRAFSEKLAACRPAHDQDKPLSIGLPDSSRRLELPACYRGRAHLECVVAAVQEESAAIAAEYEGIVRTRYRELNDADAICRLDAQQIETHLAQSKRLDLRAAELEKAFRASADCMEKVRAAVGQVDVTAMRDAGRLISSMQQYATGPVEDASKRFRQAWGVVDEIKASQKAMLTVREIRSGLCR